MKRTVETVTNRCCLVEHSARCRRAKCFVLLFHSDGYFEVLSVFCVVSVVSVVSVFSSFEVWVVGLVDEVVVVVVSFDLRKLNIF